MYGVLRQRALHNALCDEWCPKQGVHLLGGHSNESECDFMHGAEFIHFILRNLTRIQTLFGINGDSDVDPTCRSC